jgi:hypothetical protein
VAPEPDSAAGNGDGTRFPARFAGSDGVAADVVLPAGIPDRSSAGHGSQLTQIVSAARQAA